MKYCFGWVDGVGGGRNKRDFLIFQKILAVKSEDKACCLPGSMSSCRVESRVNVDERGQIEIAVIEESPF